MGPGVFVPRPETELLAGPGRSSQALAAGTTTGQPPLVVDLCTGSGAVARAARSTRCRTCRVHAVELDDHAWADAQPGRAPAVELRLGDMATAFGGLAGTVDVVAYNPAVHPARGLGVGRGRRPGQADPHLALFSGD